MVSEPFGRQIDDSISPLTRTAFFAKHPRCILFVSNAHKLPIYLFLVYISSSKYQTPTCFILVGSCAVENKMFYLREKDFENGILFAGYWKYRESYLKCLICYNLFLFAIQHRSYIRFQSIGETILKSLTETATPDTRIWPRWFSPSESKVSQSYHRYTTKQLSLKYDTSFHRKTV